MKAFKHHAVLVHGSQHGRHLLGINAERLGAPAHVHAGAAQLKVGVDAQRHAGGHAQVLGGLGQQLQLTRRLHMQQHARGHGLTQLGRTLARPRKSYAQRVCASIQRQLELAGRRHVHAIDQRAQKAHQGCHGVSLDGVVQAHARRQNQPHGRDARRDQRPVIGIKRRLTHPLGKPRQGQAADPQLGTRGIKAIHDPASNVGDRACHWDCAAGACPPTAAPWAT